MNPLVFKAIIIILLGITAFDCMGIVVRILGADYPILQVSVLRNLFGIIPALILLSLGPGVSSIKKKYTFLLEVNCFEGRRRTFGSVLLLYGINKNRICYGLRSGFTSPLFITLLSIPILGHKVGFFRLFAVFFGFLGVIAIFQPFSREFTFWLVLPIIAGFCYALSSILVRFFHDDIHSASIQIGQQLITSFVGIIILLSMNNYVVITSIEDMKLFIFMGLFGGIGVLSLVISYRMVDPATLAPFEYFGIPISFILGWFFFKEAPFGILFPGVFFIVLAGLIIIYRESRMKEK